MQLKLLELSDCKPLLNFEKQNALFFQKSIPARPKQYFKLTSLTEIIKERLQEQEQGKCFMHLVYEGEKIVARANLIDIKDRAASLGYRLSETFSNKGNATKIVTKLLSLAKTNYNLKTINATTTTTNLASIRVLQKNGFKFQFKGDKPAILHGQAIWLNHYRLNL